MNWHTLLNPTRIITLTGCSGVDFVGEICDGVDRFTLNDRSNAVSTILNFVSTSDVDSGSSSHIPERQTTLSKDILSKIVSCVGNTVTAGQLLSSIKSQRRLIPQSIEVQLSTP